MRYAIYYTPPADNSLTLAAAKWLGRDAFGGDIEAPVADEALIRDPARYGFHGTLKAPFHLADGRSEADLIDAFDRFSATTPAINIPKIQIAQIGPFFALVPAKGHEDEIGKLANAVVEGFEDYRAPLGHADIERRNPSALPDRQKRYLMKWGYPYVFEEFRFHMTLTGEVPAERQDIVRAELETYFDAFAGKSLKIAHLALFCEPSRGNPFHVLRLKDLQNG